MSDLEKRDSRWDIVPNLLALDQIAREHRSLKMFERWAHPRSDPRGAMGPCPQQKRLSAPAGFGTVGLTHSDPEGE